MAPPDGGWRKAKRKEPDASQQTDASPTASRAAKPRARTAAAGKVLDPDDYRDEVLSEIDPRSLAQARDALIVQTDRCHRLRSEKDEALAEATRLESELEQTRAQWKHAMDAHAEASTAVRDLQREVSHLREELATGRARRAAESRLAKGGDPRASAASGETAWRMCGDRIHFPGLAFGRAESAVRHALFRFELLPNYVHV